MTRSTHKLNQTQLSNLRNQYKYVDIGRSLSHSLAYSLGHSLTFQRITSHVIKTFWHTSFGHSGELIKTILRVYSMYVYISVYLYTNIYIIRFGRRRWRFYTTAECFVLNHPFTQKGGGYIYIYIV